VKLCAVTYPPEWQQPPTSTPPGGYQPIGTPPGGYQPISTPPAGYPVSPGYPGYPTSPYGQPVMPVVPVVAVVQAPPASGYAVTSLVLSIIGLVTACCAFGLPSVLAVIFGHVALSETKTGRRGGHGMAIAGLVMGYIVAVPAVVLSAMMVLGGGLESMQS
jgi:hypothetical protein